MCMCILCACVARTYRPVRVRYVHVSWVFTDVRFEA